MKKAVILVCCTILLNTVVFADSSKTLIRLSSLSSKEMKAFIGGEYDIAKTGKDFIEMVVSDQEHDAFLKAGRKVSTIIPNLDNYIATIIKSQKPGAEYFTYETMTTILQEWANKYQTIAKLVSLGKSWEGRDIWAMKVSDNPELDEKEPASLITGAHHAREWISIEVSMAALKQYLEGYGSDERLTRLINEREVWFVPMVNPDGVNFAQKEFKYWRKNRRVLDDNFYGVDLNRNYGYEWGPMGASDYYYSDVYHGPASFSEPETMAIKELADREHFQASICFHSYSELVLYPYAYKYNAPCQDTPTFKKFGEEMANINNYTAQNCTYLYPCSGTSDDWLYGAHKTLAFTVELAQTFIPPVEEIQLVDKMNVPVVFYLIEHSATYAVNSPTGNIEIAANLDKDSALSAISASVKLMPTYSEADRIKISRNIQATGKRLADLVARDILTGNNDSWNKVKSCSAADFVRPMVRDRLMFEIVHGCILSPSIMAEILQAK